MRRGAYGFALISMLALLLAGIIAMPATAISVPAQATANSIESRTDAPNTRAAAKKSTKKKKRVTRAKAKRIAKQKAKRRAAAKRQAALERATTTPTPIAAPTPNVESHDDAPSSPVPADPDETRDNRPVRNVITDRAMWLWNWDSNADVVDFALANNVTEIFTYAHPGFLTDALAKSRLVDLTARGNEAGIQMWAMGGDPSWVTNHRAALDWVAEVTGSGLFDGVHFEIEPHSQAGYWQNQDERNADFIALLHEANVAAGDTTLELSLPWWFHTIEYQGSTLDVAAVTVVDQITIVTFNETQAGIEMNAERAIKVAQAQNKNYRLASETNKVEVDWISFEGDSNSHMLTVQNSASSRLEHDPRYLGFAVQEYQGWRAMAR